MGPTLAEWRWRIGNDTGASAVAIWHAMTGEEGLNKYLNCIPHDSSDFGRCARLVHEFGWEDRMWEMGDVSPMWQAVVAHWETLMYMWNSGDSGGVNKRLYAIHDELRRLPVQDWLDEAVPFPASLKERMEALVDPDAFLPDDDVLEREQLSVFIDTLKRHPDLRNELALALAETEG